MGNMLSAPELHIDECEAIEIADALKELSRHYPIGMSEKTIAWVNFSFATAGVFGPKIKAIYERPKPQRVRVEPTPIRDVSKPPDRDVDATSGPVSSPMAGAAEPPEEDVIQ